MITRLWDPFTVVARIEDEFDQFLRRALGTAGGAGTGMFVPPVELSGEGEDLLLTLELPGVDPEQVDIEVGQGRLAISGERHDERREATEQGRVLVRELRYGSFHREFVLPEDVTAQDVTARYDRGLLTVRVKGVPHPQQPPQRIAIEHEAEPAVEG